MRKIVADALYTNIFREHGLPLEIISDRDTRFTSKIWINLFEIFGTVVPLLSMALPIIKDLMVRQKS